MPRQHSSQDVELNVTAMLDMAFQLLAFFVLTFRSGPTEPAVNLHLPAAQPVAMPNGPDKDNRSTNIASFKPAGIDTLRIELFSTNGGIDRMTINSIPAETLTILRDKLRTMLTVPDSPIEKVVVQSSESLHYGEVIKVVGICMEQKLPRTGESVKLSLVAMGDGS